MKYLLIAIFFINPYTVSAQNTESGKDSTAFLDSIFREMDDILDQLVPAKSYLLITAGAGTGFYNFRNSSAQFTSQKKLLLSPAVSYLHKSGFGISATGFIISDSNRLLPYQFSISPGYDYVKRGKFATGVAYTKYVTKKDLAFYTTPISNNIYVYFNYKKWWIQPTAALSYGWGSRKQLQEKKVDLLKLRKRLNPRLLTINTQESVSDFSGLVSLRHNFNYSGLFNRSDMFSITPVIIVNAGTQNYGSNTSYETKSVVINKFLPNNQYVSNNRQFDLQSASGLVRVDYSIHKFFAQSQFLIDYYLHPAEKRLNNAVALIIGINL